MDLLVNRRIYPRAQAEREFEAGQGVKYKVTTITWGYSDFEHTCVLDEKNVHKNIYEMTLDQFVDEWMEHFKSHHDEDIIDIEKI